MAGLRTKSKLKEIKKTRGGPSDKNSDEVNSKSVDEVNIAQSTLRIFRVNGAILNTLHFFCGTKFLCMLNNY